MIDENKLQFTAKLATKVDAEQFPPPVINMVEAYFPLEQARQSIALWLQVKSSGVEKGESRQESLNLKSQGEEKRRNSSLNRSSVTDAKISQSSSREHKRKKAETTSLADHRSTNWENQWTTSTAVFDRLGNYGWNIGLRTLYCQTR